MTIKDQVFFVPGISVSILFQVRQSDRCSCNERIFFLSGTFHIGLSTSIIDGPRNVALIFAYGNHKVKLCHDSTTLALLSLQNGTDKAIKTWFSAWNSCALTLTQMSPRNSVMNSGNAAIAIRAFSLMWIFRAETLTDTRYCAVHVFVKNGRNNTGWRHKGQ